MKRKTSCGVLNQKICRKEALQFPPVRSLGDPKFFPAIQTEVRGWNFRRDAFFATATLRKPAQIGDYRELSALDSLP
jgi:hypothetical protein